MKQYDDDASFVLLYIVLKVRTDIGLRVCVFLSLSLSLLVHLSVDQRI